MSEASSELRKCYVRRDAIGAALDIADVAYSYTAINRLWQVVVVFGAEGIALLPGTARPREIVEQTAAIPVKTGGNKQGEILETLARIEQKLDKPLLVLNTTTPQDDTKARLFSENIKRLMGSKEIL